MGKRTQDAQFGERLRTTRLRFGYESITDWASALGVSYMTYRRWEVDSSAPSPRSLSRAIKRLNCADWEKLVLWLSDEENDPPSWLTEKGPIPKADDARPRPKAIVVDSSVLVNRALPWRSLESLARAARDAADASDKRELEKITTEFLALVEPYFSRGNDAWRPDSTTSPVQPATSKEPPSSSTTG